MSQEYEQGLENLKELHQNGHIDENEYETRRGVLLDKITNVDKGAKKSRPSSRKGLQDSEPYGHASEPRPASRGAFIKGDKGKERES